MRCLWLLLFSLTAVSFAGAQVDPLALRHKNAGNRFLKERRYDQARDQYLAAIRVEPEYEDAHYNLGVIYFFRLQDYPRALYHFVEYTHLRPDAEDVPKVRSIALQALEKVEAADREAYRVALSKGTLEALQGFLLGHPDNPYGEDAQLKIQTLQEG